MVYSDVLYYNYQLSGKHCCMIWTEMKSNAVL